MAIMDLMEALNPQLRQAQLAGRNSDPWAWLFGGGEGTRRPPPDDGGEDDVVVPPSGDPPPSGVPPPTTPPPEVLPPGDGPPPVGSPPPPGSDGSIAKTPAGTVGTEGEWNSYLADPTNRAFMLNMGLQLMTGGWGGIGEQLARGIAAGAAGASATERQARADARGVDTDAGAGTGTGRGRGRRRVRRTGVGDDTDTGVGRTLNVIRVRNELATVETFLNGNPTVEQWNHENREGGLLHVAFGGPQRYEDRERLLHQVQDAGRRLPDVNVRNLTRTEAWALGQSENPLDIAAFNDWMLNVQRRRPPQGQEFFINQSGQLEARNIPGARQPGSGRQGPGAGGRFEAPTRAGIDAARLTIRNVREFLENQYPGVGAAERFISQQTGTGPWNDQLNALRNAVASYMHARSGAQTSVREFQHYVNTFLPGSTSRPGSIRGQLADLELQVLLIGRRSGENTPTEELRRLYNEVRRERGPLTGPALGDISVEEFNRLLPELENTAVGRLPGGTVRPAPGPEVRPPPSGVTPPTTPPPPPAAPLPRRRIYDPETRTFRDAP